MKYRLSDCNLSQSLHDFINQNTSTGNGVFLLYGRDASNWINGCQAVPYAVVDGSIRWNVSTKQVCLSDFAKTFQLNINSSTDFEFEETPFWGFSENAEREIYFFEKYLKHEVKCWKLLRHKIRISDLMAFVKDTNTRPRFVFDALWFRQNYSLKDFSHLFNLSDKKKCSRILEAAGFTIKEDESLYHLVFSRQSCIKDCLTKAEMAGSSEVSIKPITKIKQRWYTALNSLGQRIEIFASEKRYFLESDISCSEPAFIRKAERFDSILSSTLAVSMALFVIAVMLLMRVLINKNAVMSLDSVSGFCGSIAGAMIAGLITVYTTHLIIQRGYKIDYHQERIAQLPFFDLTILQNHMILDDKAELQEVNDLSAYKDICGYGAYEDGMLLEMTNIGNGPAFGITVSGLTEIYEEPEFSSIVTNKSKYFVVGFTNNVSCVIKYYDIYGNYYYQSFKDCISGECKIESLSCCPPELVLRANRARYIQ